MARLSPLTSPYSTKRRTTRIAMSLTVGVSGQDRLGTAFTVGGKATNLNLYGGTISIPKEVLSGSKVEVRNAKRMETAARIVRQINANGGMHTYGIEFLSAAPGFWGIHFPDPEQTQKKKR